MYSSQESLHHHHQQQQQQPGRVQARVSSYHQHISNNSGPQQQQQQQPPQPSGSSRVRSAVATINIGGNGSSVTNGVGSTSRTSLNSLQRSVSGSSLHHTGGGGGGGQEHSQGHSHHQSHNNHHLSSHHGHHHHGVMHHQRMLVSLTLLFFAQNLSYGKMLLFSFSGLLHVPSEQHVGGLLLLLRLLLLWTGLLRVDLWRLLLPHRQHQSAPYYGRGQRDPLALRLRRGRPRVNAQGEGLGDRIPKGDDGAERAGHLQGKHMGVWRHIIPKRNNI